MVVYIDKCNPATAREHTIDIVDYSPVAPPATRLQLPATAVAPVALKHHTVAPPATARKINTIMYLSRLLGTPVALWGLRGIYKKIIYIFYIHNRRKIVNNIKCLAN